MPLAYIETTIPSLYTSPLSSSAIELARQNLTRIWWDNYSHEFELVSSISVEDECSKGNPVRARARLDFLKDIPYLELTPAVTEIAQELVAREIIPVKAAEDAVHIAVASVHEVEYLVTWNCKHLANPRNWRRISDCLAKFGYRASVICTPEDLIGDGEY